jgi:acyl carrier protein
MPAILPVVMNVLAKQYPAIAIRTDTPFDELDDSQSLLDIILQIEDATGLEFTADSFDLDVPLTPMRLAQAFQTKAS